MKRVFIIMMCLSFFIVGCKKEENETGDIKYKKDVDVLSNEIAYDIDSYHIYISTIYQGMSYDESLFAYMINDDNGMFIVEYKELAKKDNMDGYNKYLINDKEYLYEYNDDLLDIYYHLDGNDYLNITIQNLNNEFNELEKEIKAESNSLMENINELKKIKNLIAKCHFESTNLMPYEDLNPEEKKNLEMINEEIDED